MYAIVKYPCNYSTFTSDVYADCVAYLTNINDLFKRFTLKTEQTETFLTVQHETYETVYSIEYIKQ
jgi:hypothetical protein